MKRKILVKKCLLFSLLIISIIGLLFSGYKMIMWLNHTETNNKLKNEINESISTENIKINGIPNERKYNIDWNSLKTRNPDTVGYLKVNNTNIDYVVVKGKDNSYYLNHNFDKEYNISGWIFMDYRNNLEKDKNIIIYGHNTIDYSMFGSLKKTLEESWYSNKDNLKIDLVTETGLKTYQIFSIYTIKKENSYIQTQFKDNIEFLDFIQKIKNRSIYDFEVDVQEEDHILTLSTCTSNGTKRVVVHAKLENNN